MEGEEVKNRRTPCNAFCCYYACRRYDVGKNVEQENVDEGGEAAKPKATLTYAFEKDEKSDFRSAEINNKFGPSYLRAASARVLQTLT